MWKFIAARATGRSHLRLGESCQDRFACSVETNGWLIVAVADGAGSAIHAAIGAERAVEVTLSHLRQALALDSPLTAVRAAVIQAREAVLAEAVAGSKNPRDYACTLLVLVAGPGGGAAAQIGDGLIAVRDSGGGWAWVFWPQRGEYANLTHFLVEPDALDVLEIAEFASPILDVALMTDGLEPLALHYASRAVHDPFLDGMIAGLRRAPENGFVVGLSKQLEAFLGSPRIAERVDDDVTLVLACRAEVR